MSQDAFELSYVNAKTFRGCKRLHVTVYDPNYEEAEKNARALLKEKDPYDCIGQTITLTGFEDPDGQWYGLKVAANGIHMGVIWYKFDDDPAFLAAYSGSITDVFLRVESDDPHPKVSLFVKLP